MIKYTSSVCFVYCTKKYLQDTLFLRLFSSSKHIFLIFNKYFAPPVLEAPLTWLRVNCFSDSSLSLDVEEAMAAALLGKIKLNTTIHSSPTHRVGDCVVVAGLPTRFVLGRSCYSFSLI